MKTPKINAALVALALLCGGSIKSVPAQEEIPFTENFHLEDCRLGPRGVNQYFIPLKADRFLLFKGEEDGETVTLRVSVLRKTRVVNGVRCAIVREMEWVGDEIAEISHNYFAICSRCHDIFYFGEDVDIYEDGEVVSHDGAWLAGVNGAKPGLIMPGRPLNGSRYFQEIAPGIAMDRAEHFSDSVTVKTPAGPFQNCLYVGETTPLEPGHVSVKYYARGVGLIQDGVLKLVEYGRSREPKQDDKDDDKD